MVKTVKITTDNEIFLVDLPEWNIDTQGAEIGADCTEIVKTQRMWYMFKDSIVMIVDESGRVNHKPDNFVASVLYGADMHGYPIAGDILFGIQRGPDVLPIENPELLVSFLCNTFAELKQAEMTAIGNKKFCIEVKEVLCRNIVLEAESLKEAERFVSAAYENGDIVLGAEDCQESTVEESLYFTGKDLADAPLTDMSKWRCYKV